MTKVEAQKKYPNAIVLDLGKDADRKILANLNDQVDLVAIEHGELASVRKNGKVTHYVGGKPFATQG